MLLPCKSKRKQNKKNTQTHETYGGTPIFDPSYIISFKFDFYFESRFRTLSLSSTILDDAVHTVFLLPPPPLL